MATGARPLPPRYFWLWHLAALKVIDADFGPDAPGFAGLAETAVPEVPAPTITGTVWDRIAGVGEAAGTVALIDTGVSRAHPNLAGRVDAERSIDLASHRYGARVLPVAPGTTSQTREGRQAFFAGLSLDGLPPLQLPSDEAEFLEAMVEEYRASEGVTRRIIDAEETFAAHGTACAGLIVGAPAPAPKVGDASDEGILPYFGVDPAAVLISIRTSFETDPLQFIAAFLFAWMQQVDAIVLPRGLPDPRRGRLLPKEDLKANLETWESRRAADLFHRLGVGAGEPQKDPTGTQEGFLPDRPWKILKHLILAISQHIPVICAAGNDGESQLIYPASLSEEGNGVIAVGAVTAEGLRSGYSNYGEGLTLVAPSDDSEVYTRHQMRLDRTDPMFGLHDYGVGAGTEVAFCPLDLVTTDLPGVFGFDAGRGPWSSLPAQPGLPGVGGGYYTAFGGTSGAASLIGGLAVLAQRARRAAGLPRWSGTELRQALVASCRLDARVAPGRRPLTPDMMNADDEPLLGPAHFFGAGLPDAGALVTAALEV